MEGLKQISLLVLFLPYKDSTTSSRKAWNKTKAERVFTRSWLEANREGRAWAQRICESFPKNLALNLLTCTGQIIPKLQQQITALCKAIPTIEMPIADDDIEKMPVTLSFPLDPTRPPVTMDYTKYLLTLPQRARLQEKKAYLETIVNEFKKLIAALKVLIDPSYCTFADPKNYMPCWMRVHFNLVLVLPLPTPSHACKQALDIIDNETTLQKLLEQSLQKSSEQSCHLLDKISLREKHLTRFIFGDSNYAFLQKRLHCDSDVKKLQATAIRNIPLASKYIKMRATLSSYLLGDTNSTEGALLLQLYSDTIRKKNSNLKTSTAIFSRL